MYLYRSIFTNVLCLALCSQTVSPTGLIAITPKQKTDYVRNIQDAVNELVNLNLSNQSCIENIYDCKKDLEKVLGKSISLDEYIDRVLNEIQKESGQRLTAKEIKSLKYKFNHPYICKAKKESSYSSDSEEGLPDLLIYNICMGLAGLFLITLPMPPLQDYGKRLFFAGVTGSGVVIVNHRYEKKQQEKKDKKDKKKDK